MYDNEALQKATNLTGTAAICVAGAETELGRSYRSIMGIRRRPGDAEPTFGEFTKGVEAREYFARKLLEGEHAFILYLDGDMEFPPDALERLRGHGLPCVSGLYYRRGWQRGAYIKPIWYEDDPEFSWPMMPFRELPQTGHLYRLGATGFGCWLIHRSVFEAIEPMLKGEAFCLEDDMDVWPYDLAAVVDGEEKLKPLRGVKSRVGADLRLSFFIRTAGFTIWGDPGVSCGHYIPYPLGIADVAGYMSETRQEFARITTQELQALREQHLQERVS